VIINGKEIETDRCILATGHSARDVYKMLAASEVVLESKSFAVGVRLELPQKNINESQWGDFTGHPRLGPASFRLTHKKDNHSRACYTFCMCPGGTVIPCASYYNEITTNGMSISKRSGSFANAAFIVPVDPPDYMDNYDDTHHIEKALLGISFQERMERLGFIAGGSDYSLPAASLSCFLKNKYTYSLPKRRSWHRSKPADLHSIFPDFIVNTLAIAIPGMLKLLRGIHHEEVLLYGPETRSSSPVRIIRNKKGESPSVGGLFPAGEGSGYSGGIVSSAVDGLYAAMSLLNSI